MNRLVEWSPEWENALQEYKDEFQMAGMDWEKAGDDAGRKGTAGYRKICGV